MHNPHPFWETWSKRGVTMTSIPCFADCVYAQNGDCRLDVIGNDRLNEIECACEFYRPKKTADDLNEEL